MYVTGPALRRKNSITNHTRMSIFQKRLLQPCAVLREEHGTDQNGVGSSRKRDVKLELYYVRGRPFLAPSSGMRSCMYQLLKSFSLRVACRTLTSPSATELSTDPCASPYVRAHERRPRLQTKHTRLERLCVPSSASTTKGLAVKALGRRR